MLALLVAAAAIVPSGVRAALVIESPQAVASARAFLESASRYAPGLTPAELGRMLQRDLGVDPFAEPKWLGKGRRVLYFAQRGIALSAPLSDVKAAKKALAKLPHKAFSGNRLLTATKPQLLASLQKGKEALPAPLRKRAHGPLWLYVAAPDPLKAAVFDLDASAEGLVARGLVLPARDEAIFAAGAAPKCEGAVACVALSPGPAARTLMRLELRELAFRALEPDVRDPIERAVRDAATSCTRAALSVAALDSQELDDLLRAAHWTAGATPAAMPQVTLQGPHTICINAESASSPCGPAPDLAPGEPRAFEARVDLAAVEAALRKLSPLDALKGEALAEAYAVHLLYGRLMQHAGPLTIRGNPAQTAADVEVRLPLH